MRIQFFRTLIFAAWLVAWTAVPCRALEWTPGWKTLPADAAGSVSAEAWTRAHALGGEIDSAATVRAAIEAWEKVAAAQPANAEAWTELACLRLLEGAAFRTRAKDRRVCYVEALQACERAMAINPEFLRRVQSGQKPWIAAEALGPREMGAMHFWSTGVFYLFRDCFGFFGRVRNVSLMDGAKSMLERMDTIDPSWEESTSAFSWGIYYLAMPSSRGGDKAKARVYFDRAVALGVNRTLPRWGRAKYFYAEMGEKAAARADLEAVAARELDGLGGNRSWNRYFKAEAAALLAR